MSLFLEERNIRLLKLLPALYIPTLRIRKDTRNIQPTIIESLNSFILSVNVNKSKLTTIKSINKSKQKI